LKFKKVFQISLPKTIRGRFSVLSNNPSLWEGLMRYLLILTGFLLVSSLLGDDAKKNPNALSPEEVLEAQDRLDVTKPAETEKFGQIKSDSHKVKCAEGEGEESDTYIYVEDPEALEGEGLPIEEIREASKRAMDSRTDRREDSWIEVFIEEEFVGPDGKKEKRETRVSKMRKKRQPKNVLEDQWKKVKKKERRIPLGAGKVLIIRANGACGPQCEGLVDKFEIRVQA